MTGQTYDVIVIGVGGMGSAAAYHLARRGLRVLGLEQFSIPHEMGSSHGVTRIIRLAYYEHPSYVPLLMRAYQLWWDLEKASGRHLLHITGSIDAGPPDDHVFTGSLHSCRQYDLPHQVLSGDEVNQRFPGYHLPADTQAVLQPQGGFLLPELCITTHVEMARQSGATIHEGEPVLGWEAAGTSGVSVRTEQDVYQAPRLVITAGAWSRTLIPGFQQLAIPERQVLGWFQTLQPDLFTPERFPVFNLTADSEHYYGFPAFGVPGFKIGCYHHLRQQVDAGSIDRGAHPEDESLLRTFAQRYFPEGAGPTEALKVCMFTNSPDEHFIIDTLPDAPQVTVAAGFSGHGFKFCSVVGEILAGLAQQGETPHDIEFLRLDRFSQV